MMAAQVGRGRSIVWFSLLTLDMGSCQKYGPFLGTLNIRCRITIGIQKGTIILTTTHISKGRGELKPGYAQGDQGCNVLQLRPLAFPLHVDGGNKVPNAPKYLDSRV